jgi:hypothetical protein
MRALVLLSLLAAHDAFACACVDWPVDRRMKEADRVFLARAKKRTSADDIQHFAVLLWLKGEAPGAEYALPAGQGDCEKTFNTDEVALVFEAHGKMPVCNGNVDLDAILPTLGDYLGGSSNDAARDVIALALGGEIHGKQPVLYAPFDKQSLSVRGGTARFTATNGDATPVLSTVTRGEFTHVTLRRPDGTVYKLIVRERGKLRVIESTLRPVVMKAR